MKVLYISSPAFFDADLSFLKSMSKKVELIFLIDLSRHQLNSTVLQISKQIDKCGIIRANEYTELSFLSNYLNQQSYVINRPRSKIFSFETLKINFLLNKFIEKHAPDVIHFNNFCNESISGILLNRFKKVITIHDPVPHIGDNNLRTKLKRKLNIFFIKKYILLNQTQHEDFIIKYKISRQDVYLSKLGIYEYYSDLLDKTQLQNSNQNKILFFGRIEEYKGVNILVKAFSKIRKMHPELELIIAGRGSLQIDSRCGISILNRYIMPSELLSLINDCSFVVCPYIEATQSGVVMTAFSIKKPVLATKVGGLPEMIEHNITGYICEPNDVDGLCDALKSLIGNKNLLQTYSSNIERDYFGKGKNSWEVITDDIRRVYNLL